MVLARGGRPADPVRPVDLVTLELVGSENSVGTEGVNRRLSDAVGVGSAVAQQHPGDGPLRALVELRVQERAERRGVEGVGLVVGDRDRRRGTDADLVVMDAVLFLVVVPVVVEVLAGDAHELVDALDGVAGHEVGVIEGNRVVGVVRPPVVHRRGKRHRGGLHDVLHPDQVGLGGTLGGA